MQDAPAFADVYWSRETALKAPAASVSAVKLWHLLLGKEGGEWLEVQQPGRVERGTVGQEEGEQQESVELSKKSRCYLGNDAESLPGRSQAGTPCKKTSGICGKVSKQPLSQGLSWKTCGLLYFCVNWPLFQVLGFGIWKSGTCTGK